MKSQCSSIQRLFSDYIDEVLSDGQVKKIDRHLALCSKCRIELRLLEKTARMLDLYIEAKPPNGYFDQVWRTLEDKVSERAAEGYLRSIKDNFTLKLRMLKNRLYDEFVWWADRVRWGKLLCQSVIVILLIFSAIVIDRTYFRPSIDEAFLQEITQSLSKDGFFLIKLSPRNDVAVEGGKPTWERNAEVMTRATYQKAIRPNFTQQPSAYSANDAVPSVIEFENGFMTIIGNIEIFDDSGDLVVRSTKEFHSTPKNITQVFGLTNDSYPQSSVYIASIQDIQQSMRRKERNNESPFSAFLADFHVTRDELRITNP